MKIDKRRYLNKGHTAVARSAVLTGLFLFFIIGLLPLNVPPIIDGTTGNPQQPTSAWSSLTNTSASGQAANFWVSGSANGTKNGMNQAAFSTWSTRQYMATPATASNWKVDRSVLTVSNMQDTVAYIAPDGVGGFGTASQWSPASAVMGGGSAIATASRITGGESPDGRAQIQLNKYTSSDNLLKHANVATGINCSTPEVDDTYTQKSQSTRNSYAYSRENDYYGCWGDCRCGYQGSPEGWTYHGMAGDPPAARAGYSYAYQNDEAVTTFTDTWSTWQEWYDNFSRTDGNSGNTTASWQIRSAVRGYGYAYQSHDSQCTQYAYSAYTIDMERLVSHKFQVSSFPFVVPSGKITSVTLRYNFQYNVSSPWWQMNGTDSNHAFDMWLEFWWIKPSGEYSPTYFQRTAITSSDWISKANNNVCQEVSSNLPTTLLSTPGTYKIEVRSYLRLRQYHSDSQAPSGAGTVTARTSNFNIADWIRMDLWNMRLEYENLNNFPYGAYTYETTNDFNLADLGNRDLLDSPDPTLYMNVRVDEITASGQESFAGAKVAAFITREDATVLVCPTAYTLYDLGIDGVDGEFRTIPATLTNFKNFLAAGASGTKKKFEVGVGVLFLDAANPFRLSTTHDNWRWWIDSVNVTITAKPYPSEVGLRWDVLVNPGPGWVNKTVTTTGYGTGTCQLSLAGDGITEFYLDVNGLNFQFQNTLTTPNRVSFSFGIITYLVYSDLTGQAAYLATSTDSVLFTIDVQIPIPRATGLDENYNNSVYHNITIPGYVVPGDSQVYWDPLNGLHGFATNPNQPGRTDVFTTRDPGSWAPGSQFLVNDYHASTDAAPWRYQNTQVLQATNQMVIKEVVTDTELHWHMNFTAPNEVAAAANIKTSTRYDQTPENDVFLLGETLYLRATYRENKGTSQAMTGLLMYNNNGSIWNASATINNAGSTQYDTNFYIGRGKGLGYVALFTYNTTNIRTVAPTMSGVYRIGFRTKSFAVTRRTVVSAVVITPKTYNTNGAENSTPITLSVEWRDAVDNTPITSADGVAVTANITIDKWFADPGAGYKRHTPENLVPSWENRTMTPLGVTGVYAVYPLPRSEWRYTPSTYGNITQGFKNFTIILQKAGYQSQVVKDNFTITMDTYLTVTSPTHDSYSDSIGGFNLPHYKGAGAQAGAIWTINLQLFERTPDEVYNDQDLPITNQLDSFYQGQIEVNYTLWKLTDLTGGDVRYAWEDVINWTYIAANPTFNYANGTFSPLGNSFTNTFKLPTYAENNLGYGDLYSGGPGEHILWYNISYRIKTNNTMVMQDAGMDYYFAGFQPNIVTNKSCETTGDTGYDQSQPGYLYDKRGKIIEEMTLVYLHKENTANVTVLNLVTTNDTDSGWAYAQGRSWNQYPDCSDGKNPSVGRFRIQNYWKNETEYSSIGLPEVRWPYLEYKYMNRTDVIRFRVMHNCTYTQAQTQNPYVPPCGPLNGTATWVWSGATVMTLYGWNETPILLTEDTAMLWNFTFDGYAGGPKTPFNIYGTTWVTPWLNITQHNAVTYADEDDMPYITARKKGFDECKLILNLTILDQATNLTIATNTETVDLDRNTESNAGNYAQLKVPVGTMRTFNLTYRDVTNYVFVPYASNKSYNVTGASILIDTDDTTGQIYLNNESYSTWWYYEYPAIPGKYNITLRVPEKAGLDITGLDQYIIKNLRFKISKQNYAPKYVWIELNVTRRAIQMNFIWGKTVAPYSSSEPGMFTLTDQAQFRWLVLSYELWDTDYQEYVDLDDYMTPLNGFDYRAAFEFDTFWPKTEKLYSVEEAQYNGHPVYNITLWPTSAASIPILGTRDVQTTVTGLTNLYTSSHNRSITIVAPSTEFRMLTANNTNIEFFPHDLTPSKSSAISFGFQLVDLNHTAKMGFDVGWPQVSLAYNVNSSWINPWSAQWTTAYNPDALMENVLHGYMRDYTIYFDIYNISVGTYSVRFNLTATNFPAVSVNLTFTIEAAHTDFNNLKVNGVTYYSDGIMNIPVSVAKDIAYSDPFNITFEWRTTTPTREMAIRNSSATTENKSVISFIGYYVNSIDWGTHQQEVGGSGTYTIKLRTNIPEDISGDGFNFVFSIQIAKNNFETQTFSFNLTIREPYTIVRMYDGQNQGIPLTDTDQEITWSDRFSIWFELLVSETPGPNDIFARKYESLNNVKYNDTVFPGTTMWTLPDGTFMGDVELTTDSGQVGGEDHYFFFVSLNTTRLNVSTAPNGLLIRYNLTVDNYESQVAVINLTVAPRTVNVAYTFGGGIVGGFIDKATVNNFTLYLDIFYDDPENPGEKIHITEDIFTVEWKLVTKAFVDVPGAGNYGTLQWNVDTLRYTTNIPVTEEMNGVLYIRFIVVCKNGNFEDLVADQYIVFQNPVEIWSWQSTLALILGIGMIGAVSIYLVRKGIQLRIPLVLRLIDETITKIQADKYPAETGVLAGRNEFMVNVLLDRLEQLGIEWEKSEKYTVAETKGGVEEKAQPPMILQEINAALDGIPELTVEEKAIFADELKRMARKEQDEFISSLKHQSN